MIAVIQDFDWRLLDGIHELFSCGFLDTVMPFITHLGSAGAFWIICGLIMLFSKKYRRSGALMLCALAAGLILGNGLIKNIVSRPRPYQLRDGIVLLIGAPYGASFPSGHTLSSVIGAVMLIKANRRFGFFAVPVAALIAFSRLYLYVHFPSDVLFGALIGLLTAFAVSKLYKRFTVRKRMGKA